MAHARTGLRWVVAAMATFAAAASCSRAGDGTAAAGGTRSFPSPWWAPFEISALATDPTAPGTLYAATWADGLFKSTDGGANWNLTGLTGVTVQSLVIDPGSSSRLYAGTGLSVFRSTDGGANWSILREDTGGPLAVDPQVSTTLYVITSSGLEVSTDDGATWTIILGNEQPNSVGSVTVARADPTAPATLYAGVYHDSPDPMSSDTGYLARSTDGGLTWWFSDIFWYTTPQFSIDPLTPSTLYSTDYGVGFSLGKSTDSGVTWTLLDIEDEITSFALGTDSLTLYAGTLNLVDVFKSTDAGSTWNSVGSDLMDTLAAYGVFAGWATIWHLSIDPVNPATVYAGTRIGVFKSTDGGDTWQPTGLFQQSLLGTVELNCSSVVGGTSPTGTVTLAAPAPEGGAVVELASSNPAVATVPATVTVPAGATSADFAISTVVVSTWTALVISASLDGITRIASLYVGPPIPPDTQPPGTALNSAVDGSGGAVADNGLTVSNGMTVTFSGTDNVGVAGFECRLDGAAFAPCSSPVTLTGLAVGQHVFDVRAFDASGNRDSSPARLTWTVDAPPETVITSAVDSAGKSVANGASISSTRIRFTFTGADNNSIAGFECSLDGAAFAPCSSPVTFSQVSKGQHTFRVRAYDNNGYRDPTPATFAWTRK